jgi:predicted DNA-binding protein with PD1-like motif
VLRECKRKDIYQGSFKKGVDIIAGLMQVTKERGFTAGIISGIGAVTEAHIGYFKAQTQKYEVRFRENMEIFSLRGNAATFSPTST